MPVHIVNKKSGQIVHTLLNPSEKARKFLMELKSNVKFTNQKLVKYDKNGKPIQLSDEQKSYRAGYLAARRDNAAAYCHKHGIQSKAKKRKRNY